VIFLPCGLRKKDGFKNLPLFKKTVRVIISGNAGSGKSTVARAVAKVFDLRHVSAGDKARRIAKKLGFKTEGEEYLKFHHYIKSHPKIDKELDKEIMKELRMGRCVVDSRLAAYLFKGKAYKIYLKVPEDVAAKRNALREGVNKFEALSAVKKRNREDALRYKKLYNIDVNDLSVFDLVLDTSHFSIKQMNQIVISLLRKVLK
jgi:cytidylate kinase